MVESERNTNLLREEILLILHRLADAILVMDSQNRAVYANHAFHLLFPNIEPDGDAIAFIGDICSSSEAFERLAEGTSRHEDLLLKDGRMLTVEVSPMSDKWLWQFADMTERKQNERARQTAEQYLEAIYTRVPVGIFTLDRNGIVTVVEGRRMDNAMLHREQVIGMSIYDLLQAIPFPYLEESLQELYAGKPINRLIELFNRAYEAHVTPTFDSTGAVDGALGVFFEATDQRRTQEALRETEEKYRSILESIEDGYYEVDLHGNFTVVNDAFARILGYSKEDFMGKAAREYNRYTDEANAALVERVFNEVYRTGLPARVETKVIHTDGSVRFVDISVALFRDASGKPVGFRGITRDVTDRKSVEQALSQRMTLLSIMQNVDMELNRTLDVEHVLSVALDSAMSLSNAEHGFIGLIEQNRISIRRASGQYADVPYLDTSIGITGRAIRRQQSELILDVYADLDYYETVPETRAQIAIPLVSHETLLGVLNLETSDPEDFTAEVFEFVQLLTARVTAALDNARLYELSQAQLADLREMEQLKTDIIRVASHDIRSPLGIVSGYIDMLYDDFSEHMRAEHRQFFTSIYTAIRRMQRMSTDILSLERVQTTKNKPQMIVYMSDMLQKALLDVRDEIRLKQHTLKVSMEEKPLTVYGSDIDLNEAIANLLSNAAKYTPDGGQIEARLSALHDDDGEWAVVEVEDSGFGIAEADQARLFQPFYRIKSDDTHRIDGTGLGLYIVKKIVEFHGGRIRFQSALGTGSTFGFQLPLVQVEAE
jgi:PAS domain S-box-containing protein